jgi:hypothetical protein
MLHGCSIELIFVCAQHPELLRLLSDDFLDAWSLPGTACRKVWTHCASLIGAGWAVSDMGVQYQSFQSRIGCLCVAFCCVLLAEVNRSGTNMMARQLYLLCSLVVFSLESAV